MVGWCASYAMAVVPATIEQAQEQESFVFPNPTTTSQPWTRWWWLGSAVDRPNLERLLNMYHEAGIGGVEICPIYGAKGSEDKFIEFLSPQWMDRLSDTVEIAKSLHMEVDLTTGTGWPFGGPNVTPDDASAKVVLKAFDIAAGQGLKEKLPPGNLHCLRAISTAGEQLDLTEKVRNGQLDWTAPQDKGKWRAYAVLQVSPVMKVKRAAPGGVGSVLDPFSTKALDKYLTRFDAAFAAHPVAGIRSHFHDSFEYYNAQWTTEFFAEFEKRRGYDLRTQLAAMFDEGETDTIARVKSDYRETIFELHLAYIERWTKWCHSHGSLSRNQAHGGPGNLLDLYAASDIPETEIFGKLGEQSIALNKFSSSAAHLTGRNLSSSESFTWLGEHFHSSLADVKQATDYLFLCGTNHILFHGIPYSPKDAPWPGWQFYAAVNFGPEGGLWHDLPAYNAYVTRCQTILQAGAPANEVLLYVPVHDVWHAPGNLILTNPMSKSMTATAMKLWERGYTFDYLSDRFAIDLSMQDGRIHTLDREKLPDFVVDRQSGFRAVLVPSCRRMPVETLKKLLELAESGATILFHDGLPADVPGWKDLEKRRVELKAITAGLSFEKQPNSDVQVAKLGTGKIVVGTDVEALLANANVSRETLVDLGLQFVRRVGTQTKQRKTTYFIANRGKKLVNDFVSVVCKADDAVILDPRTESPGGWAEIKPEGNLRTKVRIQLQPGESCILQTSIGEGITHSDELKWKYTDYTAQPITLAGRWNVKFIEGGPVLPAEYETDPLSSWTTRDDPECKRFAGTARYTTEFVLPGKSDTSGWLLDLGHVCESARVLIDGKHVGTVFSSPSTLRIDGSLVKNGSHKLEIEVTNLAMNRIADLDRRKVNWKYFYDANLASLQQKSGLDATNWPLRDSGLIGPVRLFPLKK